MNITGSFYARSLHNNAKVIINPDGSFSESSFTYDFVGVQASTINVEVQQAVKFDASKTWTGIKKRELKFSYFS